MSCTPPGNLPNPGIEPRSPTLQADSLPAEPQGKSKNTGVGSLSLLQQIFPTQVLIHGLLHCRRILYQLSSVSSTDPSVLFLAQSTYLIVGYFISFPRWFHGFSDMRSALFPKAQCLPLNDSIKVLEFHLFSSTTAWVFRFFLHKEHNSYDNLSDTAARFIQPLTY